MKRLLLVAAFALLSACTTYTTPAAGVSLAAISEKDSDIRDAYARAPAMTFPARMVVARVASPGYTSYTNVGYGAGVFSVITRRDIESEEALARLATMPDVAAVAPLSRILLPTNLRSTRDLREAAAQLRADAVLVYTLDTSFRTDTTQLGPLQTVALGMLSSKNSIVTSTCSFAIIDARTGFIYGTGETTATEEQRSNMWGTVDAADKARQRAETRAFEDGVAEVARLWTSIVSEHANRT